MTTTTNYLAYHAVAPLISSDEFVPIQVGRALAERPLDGMIGDDTGDNISELNRSYCELTGLYWAWKNDTTSDYIGLGHYRRLLGFAGETVLEPAELFVDFFEIDEYLKSSRTWIDRHISEFDIICPVGHEMAMTVEENYTRAHRVEEWRKMLAVLRERNPEFDQDVDEVIHQNEVILANMFVMRREILDEYCEWLFPILAEVRDADIDRSTFSAYDRRSIGFLAERLFTIWIHHVERTRPELRIKRVNILNLSESLVVPYANPGQFVDPVEVNIAFASDLNFLPHTAAMVKSLVGHTDPGRRYNLFWLATGIPDKMVDGFQQMLLTYDHVKLHVLPVGDYFSASHRSSTRAPSNATYNRLLLFSLFPHIRRILYIDVDMIVCGDVAEIFDYELDGKAIAAVPDFIMTRSVTGVIATKDANVPDLFGYQKAVLEMSEEQALKYFNAGLLVFNFEAFEPVETGRKLMAMAATGKYLFRDQDILNSYFRDSYCVLPAKYNVFNSPTAAYDRVPAENRATALEAKRDPFIVHFASGEHKPWSSPGVAFSELYWQSLIQTPFYFTVIRRTAMAHGVRRRLAVRGTVKPTAVKGGKAIAERFPATRSRLIKISQRVFK